MFQFNYFMSTFRNVSNSLKIHLFKNFCYSFFGSQLWDLQHRSIYLFDVLWRKAVRRLWHIFLILLIATYSRHLLSEIIFVLFYLIDFLISRVIVLAVVIKVHIKFDSFLAAVSQMHVLEKTYFICQI